MNCRHILIAGLTLLIVIAPHNAKAQSDDKIKEAIIAQSIRDYPGNCPCPYNTDRAGRRCGKRSAYSKPGGHAPVCYPSDVTPAMIKAYKQGR